MIFYHLHAVTKTELAEAKDTIENLKTTLNGEIIQNHLPNVIVNLFQLKSENEGHKEQCR
jgi:hypothetical protein